MRSPCRQGGSSGGARLSSRAGRKPVRGKQLQQMFQGSALTQQECGPWGGFGCPAKYGDSFEDDKSKILMIHFGIGHNMASGNKENQLLEMKQQCPPNAMLHIDLEVISWKVGSL